MLRVSRKEWPVSQLTGVYGMLRVPRNLDCTRLGDRSLLPWSIIVSTHPKFSIWMIRETPRGDNQIRIKEKKILISEMVWCVYPWILAYWICLCSWLFLFTRTLTLVVVDSSSFRIEEYLHKMAISLKNCRVDQKNHSSLAWWHDLPFVSSDHLLRLLDILSVDLYTSVSLPQSKTQLQKAFSPNAGALSLWHSPPLRGIW